MKRFVLVCWLVCVALAASHLLSLATFQISLELCVVMALVLAWYSLPFLLLAQLKLRPGQPLRSALAVTLVLLVAGIDIFTSARRFLPGYRPEALESIIYLVVPVVECLPIGLALAIL